MSRTLEVRILVEVQDGRKLRGLATKRARKDGVLASFREARTGIGDDLIMLLDDSQLLRGAGEIIGTEVEELSNG